MPRVLKGFMLSVCLLFAGSAGAQQFWEVGAIGGYGFARDLTLKGPLGTANAGFNNGIVFGGFIGEDTYNYFSGEARYMYRSSGLKLSSGGTRADFAANTHIVNADFLAHFQPRSSPVRAFVCFGGGVKVLRGAGMESASQPLGGFAGLTHTREVLPTGDIGAGVKITVSHSVRIRLEVRDYISSQPNAVIAPAPGVAMKGILNDILSLASISYAW